MCALQQEIFRNVPIQQKNSHDRIPWEFFASLLSVLVLFLLTCFARKVCWLLLCCVFPLLCFGSSLFTAFRMSQTLFSSYYYCSLANLLPLNGFSVRVWCFYGSDHKKTNWKRINANIICVVVAHCFALYLHTKKKHLHLVVFSICFRLTNFFY